MVNFSIYIEGKHITNWRCPILNKSKIQLLITTRLHVIGMIVIFKNLHYKWIELSK